MKALLLLVLAVVVLCSEQHKRSCLQFCAQKGMKKSIRFAQVPACIKQCIQDNVQNHKEEALADTTGSYTVNAPAGVNLRSSICTGNVIAILPQNTAVNHAGQSQSGCGYTWYYVSSAYGSGWVASSFLTAGGAAPPQQPPQRPPQQPPSTGSARVYGDIGGLTAPMLQKMQEIANLFKRNINVISGKRNWGDNQHKVGEAADFHVEGWSDEQAGNFLKQNRKILNGCQLIYHVPGARSCTSGEHLHISRPSGYRFNSFCREKACAFNSSECDFLGNQ